MTTISTINIMITSTTIITMITIITADVITIIISVVLAHEHKVPAEGMISELINVQCRRINCYVQGSAKQGSLQPLYVTALAHGHKYIILS